jgi:ACS family hexuronate transporter-like MFS transporter
MSRKPHMSIPHLRWYMAAMFFLATVISYVDRQALSVNAPFIRDDLGLSNVQYSQLVTAFLVAYTIGQGLTGRLVDGVGTRLGFAISITWWSIAGMLHAAARGFGDLAAYRFLLGLGEAGSWPASMRGTSEWFPLRERSLAVGVFGSGTAVGALISAPLVAGLTLLFGWRWCFLVTGATGFLWLIVWVLLYRLPEHHRWLSPAERSLILAERRVSPRQVAMWDLLRHRAPWGVVLGRSLVDPAWWFYVFWLPNYLKNERGFGLEAIGLFAWIPFLTADIGNLAGGWLSGHLLRRGHSLTVARKRVLLLGAVGTLFGVPAVTVAEAWLCLACISAATFSFGLWTTNAMTLNADVVPPEAVGRMTGLSGMGSGLGGIVFTLSIGWLVDRFSYVPVFWLAGALPLLGYLLLTTFAREIRPIDLAPRPLPAARPE